MTQGRPRTATPSPQQTGITAAAIKAAVCRRYGINPGSITSPCRIHAVSHPRHVAIYLATKLTALSLAQIGIQFGRRHHATIVYSVRSIQQRLRAGEVDTTRAVEELAAELSA